MAHINLLFFIFRTVPAKLTAQKFMILEQITNKFSKNPKRLFLIDGIGAILSAFLLGVILVKLEYLFGIPKLTLYSLAAFPVFFALFDFYSYQKDHTKLNTFLKRIAFMNLLYCILSIGLAVFHYQTITTLGWAYIITEILIIMILTIIEFKVSKKLSIHDKRTL